MLSIVTGLWSSVEPSRRALVGVGANINCKFSVDFNKAREDAKDKLEAGEAAAATKNPLLGGLLHREYPGVILIAYFSYDSK